MRENCCTACGGKFGLISYFWLSNSFCRKKCLEKWLSERESFISHLIRCVMK